METVLRDRGRAVTTADAQFMCELIAARPAGEHDCRTSEEALAVIRSMATRWSDEDIAATLNRIGLPTGQGKTRTVHRVSSLRRVRGTHAYKSAKADGEWLTISKAHRKARRLKPSDPQAHQGEGVLVAEQVVPDAPYQIRATDLQDERVISALAHKGRPCRPISENQTSMFSDT
jgi:hypothetical protein